MLDGAGCAAPAIAQEGRRLAVDLGPKIVEGILQHGRNAVVVFRGDEDVAVNWRSSRPSAVRLRSTAAQRAAAPFPRRTAWDNRGDRQSRNRRHCAPWRY